MQGQVIQSTGSWYIVLPQNTPYHPQNLLQCRLKGKMRLQQTDSQLNATNPITIGDYVTLELEPNLSQKALITNVLPRHNYIIRQSPRKQHHQHIIAANIDQIMLIVTFSMPRTSFGFIDRFIATAEMYHIPTILVFNKLDIYSPSDIALFEYAQNTYQLLNYPCFLVSAETQEGIPNLIQSLQNKTTLVAGHSGVGKSSIINRLNPQLQLNTQNISNYTQKGMHTTTFSTMHPLQNDENKGFIIDMPGIKEFGIVDVEPQEIGGYFKEIAEYAPNCQFKNCMHQNEPQCAVLEALEAEKITETRFLSYLKMLEDAQNTPYWQRKIKK